MTPGAYSLSIYRGDSYSWEFLLWQDAAKTIPMSTAGAVANAQIRNAPGGQLLAQLTTTIGSPNIVNMFLDAPTSRSLNPGLWSWDLQVTYNGGIVQTVLAGNAAVTEDVSQP